MKRTSLHVSSTITSLFHLFHVFFSRSLVCFFWQHGNMLSFSRGAPHYLVGIPSYFCRLEMLRALSFGFSFFIHLLESYRVCRVDGTLNVELYEKKLLHLPDDVDRSNENLLLSTTTMCAALDELINAQWMLRKTRKK